MKSILKKSLLAAGVAVGLATAPIAKAADAIKGGHSDEAAFNEQLRIALRRELFGVLNKKPVVTTNLYLV